MRKVSLPQTSEWKRMWLINEIKYMCVYFGAVCPYLISFSSFYLWISKSKKNAKNVISHWSYTDRISRAIHGNSCIARRSSSRKLYIISDNDGITDRHKVHVGNHCSSPLVCVRKNHAYNITVTQHFASNLSNTGAFVYLTRSKLKTKDVVQPEVYEMLPDIYVHAHTLSEEFVAITMFSNEYKMRP